MSDLPAAVQAALDAAYTAAQEAATLEECGLHGFSYHIDPHCGCPVCDKLLLAACRAFFSTVVRGPIFSSAPDIAAILRRVKGEAP